MMVSCLLDTNILLYLANTRAPQHAAATHTVEQMLANGDRLVIATQVLFEFWSVATRPASANGLGWSTSQARAAIDEFRGTFASIPEPPAVVDFWLELVSTHDLKGKRVHDAHLLATMKANGIARLLTFNTSDFPPDPALSIIAPGPA